MGKKGDSMEEIKINKKNTFKSFICNAFCGVVGMSYTILEKRCLLYNFNPPSGGFLLSGTTSLPE